MALIKPAVIPKLEDIVNQEPSRGSIGPSKEELTQLFDSVPILGTVNVKRDILSYLSQTEPYYPVIQSRGKALLLAVNKSDFKGLVWISSWFEVESAYKSTQNVYRAKLRINGEIVDVDYESLYPKDIVKLSRYGLLLDQNYADAINKYIFRILARTDVVEQPNGMGFSVRNDKLSFRAYDAKPQILQFTESLSLEDYVFKLNKLLTNPSLIFALCCSCATLFLAYLSIVCDLPLQSFIISFYGKTTTGKSTAQTLMASVFTDPKDKKVYAPFFGTLNAILKIISGKFGIPQIFDEATVSSGIDLEKLFYMVSLEEDKHRCTGDMTLREQETWKTIVITSSENRLLPDSRMHNRGLDTRILSFMLKFTDSREHSDSIHEFCRSNYGILGKALSKHLINASPNNIFERYDGHRKSLRETLTEAAAFGIAERLINEYSIIMLAADILTDFGVAIDLDSIKTIITDNLEAVRSKADTAERYYDHIISYIIMHPHMDGTKKLESDNTVAIIDELFIKILEDHGASNPDLVIDELIESGYLNRRKSGAKKNRLRFNGVIKNCYEIKLPENSESDEDHMSLEYVLTHFEGLEEL
ncbi:MAG: DUF927 domain-containing protein [Oscillospiraceae bacterium]|nr:DUF927 domain-containing protein [Oscillospiraceae bacterium]